MRLHLFFILLGLLYSSCSQLPSRNDEDSVAESVSESQSKSETSGFETRESYKTIYPQDVVILNQRNNCYINALLYSLYNIPFFQLSVFKTISEVSAAESDASESSLIASPLLLEIGRIFKELRMNSEDEHIDLSYSFFPAISHQMGWEVGAFECVLEFWDRLIGSMPESHMKPFKENFEMNLKHSFFRKEDGKYIESITENVFNIVLSLDSEDDERANLGQLFLSSFNGEDLDSFLITPEEYPDLFKEGEKEPQRIKVEKVTELENTPPVIVVGIKRVQVDPETKEYVYNGMLLDIDPFTIGTETYTPITIVGFIADENHYINLTPDLGEILMVHDDSKLFGYKHDEEGEVADFVGATATLVFYVKNSLWNDKFDGIVEEADNGYDIQEAIDSLRACKSLKGSADLLRWFLRGRDAEDAEDARDGADINKKPKYEQETKEFSEKESSPDSKKNDI